MSSPIATTSASTPSSLQPVATNTSRRVSFGSTPKPDRHVNFRTPSKITSATSSKTSELHHQFVPAEKMKSMSDLDKEQEARMAKLHEAKAKKGVAGVMNWLKTKVNSDGAEDVRRSRMRTALISVA